MGSFSRFALYRENNLMLIVTLHKNPPKIIEPTKTSKKGKFWN